MENLDKLVTELCKLPNETQWVEFKHNNYYPDMIGQDICVLTNSAALHEKSCAYMLWGVDDKTHEIVGTEFNLHTVKRESRSWKTGCEVCCPRMRILNFTRLLFLKRVLGF